MSEAYDNHSVDSNLIETELQVRLMNLVMGEASDFERDQLQLMMEQRPELATYYQHIEHLHGLLREVGAGDPEIENDSPAVDADWRLPADRRERVLAVLENRSSIPPEKVTLASKRSFRNWRPSVMEAIMVASIACVVLGLMLPATQSARESAKALSVKSRSLLSFSSEAKVPLNAPMYRSTAVKPLASVPEPDFASLTPDSIPLYTQPNEFLRGRPAQGWERGANGAGAMAQSTNGIAVPGQTLPSPHYLSDDVQYLPASPENKTTSVPPSSGPELGLATNRGRQAGGEKQLNENFLGSNALVDRDRFGLRDETEGRPNAVALQDGTGGSSGIESSTNSPSSLDSRRYIMPNTAAPAFSPDLDIAVRNNFGITPSFGAPNVANDGLPSPSSSSSAQEYSDLPSITESSKNILDSPEAAVKTELDGLLAREFAEKPGTTTNWSVEGYDAKTRAEDFELKLNRYDQNDQALAPSLLSDGVPPVTYPNEDVWKELSQRRMKRYGSIELKQLGQKAEDNVRTLNTIPKQSPEEATLEQNADEFVTWMSTRGTEEKRTVDHLAENVTPSKGKPANPKPAPSKPATSKLHVTLDEQSASIESFSTFSLHVSDVSFKLAQAALSQSQWPEANKIRIEEFVNAMDYHDPLPSGDQKIACRVEQAIHPFLMQRNLLRVSMRTAATGRSQNTPLRLTLLLDNSGSMERTDRRQALLRAFQTLTQQLKETDQVTLISFASTPRLLADKFPGNQGDKLMQLIENLPSQGGTNIEAALQLAREKAAEQKLEGAQNRIVLITDGAVNLGNANPESLAKQVSAMRDAGIAFDAAGISAQDLNDEVLEALTRQGDGRYYLLDSAETAGESFAAQIAGALRPSAQNVKVQVEFNPQRVGRYKLLGYEKHRLNKEDFRNDQVDAAEMAAAEAGVAVYQYEIKPKGVGDVGSVSVRFRDLSSGQMVERRWPILHESNTPRLEQAQASMQLAATAALFAAKLGGGPLADNVDLAQLQNLVAKLPEQFASQPRVQQLLAMIEQAIAIH